ncbi:MAG: YtxH domain-containing protein [Chloroflexi bacterium]|nr:YtxH domain-containing protein [Chloroflexota bacterium]
MRRVVFFVLGLLFGAALGAPFAFLLAPASGQSLRKQAEQRVRHALQEAQAAAEAKRKALEAELAAFSRRERAGRR